MAVIINDTCITCDACAQQCPVGAIVDDLDNPTGNARYYVQPEKCVECVDIYDDPQCAAICPSIGCITWDMPYTKEHHEHFVGNDTYAIGSKNGTLLTPQHREKKYRKDIFLHQRNVGEFVEKEPQDQEVG
jgi:Fe-S-cluster-containing hydrogenase component 2